MGECRVWGAEVGGSNPLTPICNHRVWESDNPLGPEPRDRWFKSSYPEYLWA